MEPKLPQPLPPELQSAALEASANAIVITDRQGTIRWVNPAFTKLTGWAPSEAVGQNPRILKSGKTDPSVYEKLWKTILSGRVWHGEIINRRRDGSLYTEENTITPVCDEHGRVTHFIEIKQDVTQRLADLEKIKNEKARDEAILSSIGDGVVVLDQAGKILMLNLAACGLLNCRANVIGKHYADVWTLENEDGLPVPSDKRPIAQVLASGKTLSSNKYYYVRDHQKFPVSTTVAPIILDNELIGVVDVFRDITREKEIDREKTEFISVAAHQLRTPLGIMRWNLELLLGGDRGQLSPEIAARLKELYDTDLRLIALVNDLLDVLRIEQRRSAARPASTQVVEVLTKVIAAATPLLKKRGLSLEFLPPAVSPPQVWLDPEQLYEVIDNLVSNAIKYTKEGQGKVKISLSQKDGRLILTVSDNGIGIRQSDQNRIFDKFFRGENALKIDPAGSGLGLFVAKAYVTGWGGKVWVESQEGKGATFFVEIPLPTQK